MIRPKHDSSVSLTPAAYSIQNVSVLSLYFTDAWFHLLASGLFWPFNLTGAYMDCTCVFLNVSKFYLHTVIYVLVLPFAMKMVV